MLFMEGMGRGDARLAAANRRWIRAVRYYIENRDDQLPPAERFNAGQKQFYWGMFWGAIVLLLSGLVLWFPELMPAGLHWLRGVAILTHEIAALVTIGLFIIHV